MRQLEIKIVVFNPTSAHNNFAADIYVDGKRQHCGKGGHYTVQQAIDEAADWLKQWDDINWRPK